MSDIEIARKANKKPIQEIGNKLGIPTDHLLPFGHDGYVTANITNCVDKTTFNAKR